MRRWLVWTAMAVLSVACGGDDGARFAGEPDAETVARGERVYHDVCRECHTLRPPARLAPPLVEVSRAVRAATEDRAAFTEHIMGYSRAPSQERSFMPEETVRRFGLMPPQLLSESRLQDAAAFVWTLVEAPEGPSAGSGG